MFCKSCGKEIKDDAVICVNCGCATGVHQNMDKVQTQKSKVAAILLCIFLGGFGIHRFYVGKTGSGIAMLLITLLTGWLLVPLAIVGIWAIVDLILICTNNFKTIDGNDLV